MFRYYVTYSFNGGTGSADINAQKPISTRADLNGVMDTINRANGRILPNLLIMGFSLYFDEIQSRPTAADSNASR